MNNARSTEERIVAGGGWTYRTDQPQPKARALRMLTLLWIFPSLGSVVVLMMCGERWWDMGSFSAVSRALTMEQWIALGLLLAHPVFAALAWHFRRTEELTEGRVRVPNPDHDLRKLY
jgi:hypothetical protein